MKNHLLNITSFFLLSLSSLNGSGKMLFSETSGEAIQFGLNSEHLNDTVQVHASLPKGYEAGENYPLLLLLDGEYAFEPASNIISYLQRDKEISKFVTVGVSYGVGFGEPLAEKRSRDFTPPLDENRIIESIDTPYYHFIRDELLPMLDEKLKIDPDERTLWSYSLSGSLAAWLSYYDPSLFKHYIFASGNLIDFGIIQKLFAGEIFRTQGTPNKKVFMSYDRIEIPDPTILEQGRAQLESPEAFPGYDIKFYLTENETHASSWFVSMPASLRHIYGSKK